MTGKQFNCSGTDEVVCPYCGHMHSDSWEWFSGANVSEQKVDCENCDKAFIIVPDFVVTYYSYKVGENGGKANY